MKKILILHSINPDITKSLARGISFDLTERGLNWPNYGLTASWYTKNTSQSFLKEIVELKILELTPYRLTEQEGCVDSVVELIQQLEDKSVKAHSYNLLIQRIRNVLHVLSLGNCIESIRKDMVGNYHIPNVQLFLISCALMAHDEASAERQLKAYIAHCGLMNIHLFIAVAHLAKRMGYCNEKIYQASYLFEKMTNQQSLELVLSKLREGNLAIVGNGPQEVGKCGGMEIDAHQSIIRFNNFKHLTDNLHADYGTKTTLWFFTVPELNEALIPTDANICILGRCPYLLLLFEQYFDAYVKLSTTMEHITYIPLEIRNDLFRNYKMPVPTTGLMAVYWTRKLNPSFSIENCYGFSFKGEYKKDAYVQCGATAPSSNEHDMNSEIQMLKGIFNSTH